MVETAAKAGRKFDDDAVGRTWLPLPTFLLIVQYLYWHKPLQSDRNGLLRSVSAAEMKGDIQQTPFVSHVSC